MHPGGLGVLVDEEVGAYPIFQENDEADRVAGQDATTVFYSLHRSEILQKPQYARLKIGQIEGQTQQIKAQQAGDLSRVRPHLNALHDRC